LRAMTLVGYLLLNCSAILAQVNDPLSPGWSSASSAFGCLLQPPPSDCSDAAKTKKPEVGVHEIPLSQNYEHYLHKIPPKQGPDLYLRAAPWPWPGQSTAYTTLFPPLVDID
jgi:hypothetical protein